MTKTKKLVYKLGSLLNIFAKEGQYNDLELIIDLQASYREAIAESLREESEIDTSSSAMMY